MKSFRFEKTINVIDPLKFGALKGHSPSFLARFPEKPVIIFGMVYACTSKELTILSLKNRISSIELWGKE